MISIFFGLPGCGKTTLAVHFEKKFVHSKKYKYVYSNVGSSVDGVVYIDPLELGRFEFEDALIIIDEAQLSFDSRDYMIFSKALKTFFFMHRHHNADVFLFAQRWDGIDKNIRMITNSVYYVYKPILHRSITKWVKVPYGVVFPEDGDKAGEIVMGYRGFSKLQQLFAPRIKRKKYYSLFDSWQKTTLPYLAPERYLDCSAIPPLPYEYSDKEKAYVYVS